MLTINTLLGQKKIKVKISYKILGIVVVQSRAVHLKKEEIGIIWKKLEKISKSILNSHTI